MSFILSERDEIATGLRALYRSTTQEPVPQDFLDLLARLK